MLAQDGTYLLAFDADGVDAAIGDIVTVTGKVDVYSGLKQIASPVVAVVSTGNEVVLPEPKVVEDVDSYASDKIELIQYVGKLTISGSYYNVVITGAERKGSIQYPLNTDELAALKDKSITATGFFTGISGSSTKYVNMMATSVEEYVGNVFEVTPVEISLPATATSTQINVTGNVDWTAESATEGAEIDKTSGSGDGVITVTLPANTSTEEEKSYTVFVRTEASDVNDEFEVTITQAKAVKEGATVIFNETFDNIEGTGGRDGQFSGSIASNDFVNTDEVWSAAEKVSGANKSAKFGTGSVNGTMTTRSISLNGDAVLTFEAAGWASGSNSLTVSAAGATLSGDTSITLTNSSWTAYSVAVSGVTGSFTLTFTGRRGFIDSIKVTTDDEVPQTTATLASIAVSGQTTVFSVGDTFEFDGTVTATYSDNTTKDVTASATVSEPDMSTAGTKEVTVTYTEGEDTKTASYTITVNAVVVGGLTFDFSDNTVNGLDEWPGTKEAAAEGTYVYKLNDVDYSFTTTKVGNGIYMNTSYLFINSGNYLGLPAIEGKKLVSVTAKLNPNGNPSVTSKGSVTSDTSGTLVTGGDAQTFDVKGGTKTFNLTGTAVNTVYYLAVTNKNFQCTELVLVYE